MLNVLTRVVSGFALATVLAGSASAAGATSANHPQPMASNPALQAQLDRDNPSETWLHRSPLGQVIAPGNMQSADSSDQMSAERGGHMHLSHDN
jgi:hypothetical protein